MIIYNVTVNVEDSILEEWKAWMINAHIKDVLETGLFSGYTFSQVMVDEEVGTTYSIQYFTPDMESFQLYEQLYAPKLRQETAKKYGQKIVAFRTLLKIIDSK
jgi:hypothetical protein